MRQTGAARKLSGRRRTLAGAWICSACLLFAANLNAETCTTQSQMNPAERDSIVATVRNLAGKVQANDVAGVRAQTIPEYAKDFSAMTSLVGNTSAKVKGAQFLIDQVYLLDATTLKPASDGTNQDAQFFCSLNKSMAETSFLIPALPPGRYSFATVTADLPKTPWRMSFLLRQEGSAPPSSGSKQWSMAGFYPKPLTAAGHDGLWYWTQARELSRQKQPWSAYLYYQQAAALLQPVGFLSSTHLEKLRKETTAAAPPALVDGVTAEAPLVMKGLQGAEYRFTELTTDDSLGLDKVDIVVHLQAEPTSETITAPPGGKAPATRSTAPAPATPRERNNGAMAALLTAYPELREHFHVVWVFAESPGRNPFVTEEAMANIH